MILLRLIQKRFCDSIIPRRAADCKRAILNLPLSGAQKISAAVKIRRCFFIIS